MHTSSNEVPNADRESFFSQHWFCQSCEQHGRSSSDKTLGATHRYKKVCPTLNGWSRCRELASLKGGSPNPDVYKDWFNATVFGGELEDSARSTRTLGETPAWSTETFENHGGEIPLE